VTRRPRLVLPALASLALAASACQPPVFFPEIAVDASTVNALVDDAVINEDGTFIVTWSQLDSSADVLGRRFDADTAPLGDPFPLSTGVDQRDVSIARDASGRLVAVWSEDVSTQIWGRRFDTDGTPLGDKFQINTSTPLNSLSPHVASDPSGNFAVTWTSSLGGGNAEVLARRYDSNGAPLGDEFPVNLFTSGVQSPSGIAMSPKGFVVTWRGDGEEGRGVFGRRFNAAGQPMTDDIQVNTTSPVVGDFISPDVAMNAAGDFVVVWAEGDFDDGLAMGRRFASSGTPLGGVFPISDATATKAYEPRVASDSAGNFVVAWTSYPSAALSLGLDPHVAAHFYNIDGSSASSEFQVNQFTTGYQFRPRPSLADNGSYVVAFGSGLTAPLDVKVRKSGVRAAPEIVMDQDPTLASSPGAAPGNGVFEPGETQTIHTGWANDTAGDVDDIVATTGLFTGPPGADYTINHDVAGYLTLPAGQIQSCIEPDCFSVTVSNPVTRPDQHWDALLQEETNMGLPHTWVLHLGESFPDVPTDNLFYKFVETLFHKGVTTGCAGGVNYCPSNPVTRAQMAVFLLKSKFGQFHIPPPCAGTVFPDVPCTGGPFDPWIEELAALQITGGCGGGNYCPNNTVTRQQMAVFLLKALEGSAYDPPDCAGIFSDVACTPGTGFSDWIEELYNRSITGGCSVTPLSYCPTNPNNRGQMAVFLVKTFGLVLYGG